jgi:hypothetical protein
MGQPIGNTHAGARWKMRIVIEICFDDAKGINSAPEP